MATQPSTDPKATEAPALSAKEIAEREQVLRNQETFGKIMQYLRGDIPIEMLPEHAGMVVRVAEFCLGKENLHRWVNEGMDELSKGGVDFEGLLGFVSGKGGAPAKADLTEEEIYENIADIAKGLAERIGPDENFYDFMSDLAVELKGSDLKGADLEEFKKIFDKNIEEAGIENGNFDPAEVIKKLREMEISAREKLAELKGEAPDPTPEEVDAALAEIDAASGDNIIPGHMVSVSEIEFKSAGAFTVYDMDDSGAMTEITKMTPGELMAHLGEGATATIMEVDGKNQNYYFEGPNGSAYLGIGDADVGVDLAAMDAEIIKAMDTPAPKAEAVPQGPVPGANPQPEQAPVTP